MIQAQGCLTELHVRQGSPQNCMRGRTAHMLWAQASFCLLWTTKMGSLHLIQCSASAFSALCITQNGDGATSGISLDTCQRASCQPQKLLKKGTGYYNSCGESNMQLTNLLPCCHNRRLAQACKKHTYKEVVELPAVGPVRQAACPSQYWAATTPKPPAPPQQSWGATGWGGSAAM